MRYCCYLLATSYLSRFSGRVSVQSQLNLDQKTGLKLLYVLLRVSYATRSVTGPKYQKRQGKQNFEQV